jgi:hypothetical protein
MSRIASTGGRFSGVHQWPVSDVHRGRRSPTEAHTLQDPALGEYSACTCIRPSTRLLNYVRSMVTVVTSLCRLVAVDQKVMTSRRRPSVAQLGRRAPRLPAPETYPHSHCKAPEVIADARRARTLHQDPSCSGHVDNDVTVGGRNPSRHQLRHCAHLPAVHLPYPAQCVDTIVSFQFLL